jgi:hypothetical protein
MNRIVEEEQGSSFATQHRHPHNGYYAGDFSAVPFHLPEFHTVSQEIAA